MYVESFSVPGARALLSRDGGLNPRWAPDAGELFFVEPTPEGNLRMMAVEVRGLGARLF